MRFSSFCLSLLLALLFTVVSPAQDEQPTEVVSHWSAYEYPTDLPEDTRVHIIVKGNTLWDLAQQYYNNPLIWPQIHDANPYIKNPNLIYPGDPVVLPDLNIVEPGRMRRAEAQTAAEPEESEAETEDQVEQPRVEKEGMPFSMRERVMFEVEPAPSQEYTVAAGTFEMYCAPMVYGNKKKPELWIAGTEENDQIEIQPYDIVYINRGEGFVEAGEIYVATNYIGEVYRPSDNGFIGYGYHDTGLVKIHVVAKEFAIGEVISSCDGCKIGSLLYPFEELPIPVTKRFDRFDIPTRYFKWSDDQASEIVFTWNETLTLSTHDLVCVELTEEFDYAPGDKIVLFRHSKINRLYDEFKTPDGHEPGEIEGREGYGRSDYNIAHVEGVAVVLRTTDVSALVKILHTARYFKPGDLTTDYSMTVAGTQ